MSAPTEKAAMEFMVLSLQRHRVALVSDFFYPSIGGRSITYMTRILAQCLVECVHD